MHENRYVRRMGMILLVQYIGHRPQSTYVPRVPHAVSVPSYELGPLHPLSRNRDTLACGWGGGGSQFGGLEKKSLVLCLLCGTGTQDKDDLKNIIFSSKLAMAFALVWCFWYTCIKSIFCSYVGCSVKFYFFPWFYSFSFRTSEWTIPRHTEFREMSIFFRGITKPFRAYSAEFFQNGISMATLICTYKRHIDRILLPRSAKGLRWHVIR
jgi:hypothetical protein